MPLYYQQCARGAACMWKKQASDLISELCVVPLETSIRIHIDCNSEICCRVRVISERAGRITRDVVFLFPHLVNKSALKISHEAALEKTYL